MAPLVDGRYELIDVIGSGGMATVWRARDTKLERHVALKRPHPMRHDDPRFDRLSREARLAASISHPHLVSVHDAGADSEGLYLVMELVEAPSLAQVGSTLTPDTIIETGMQVSRALAAVHRAGVVHRDVKPGNILMAEGGAKLTDFGIAVSDSTFVGDQPTAPGTLLATANYAAPEILAGHPAVDRSDIFALGVVLYELLAGHPPFAGVDRTRRPATLGGSVGPILAQCLSPYPDDRPSANALASDLNGALADLRAAAVRSPVSAPPPSPSMSSTAAMPMAPAAAAVSPPVGAPPMARSSGIGGHDPTATQVMGNRPPMAFGDGTATGAGSPVAAPGPMSGMDQQRRPPSNAWMGPAALGAIGLIAVVTVLALLSGVLDNSAGNDQAASDGGGEPQTSVTVPTADDDDADVETSEDPGSGNDEAVVDDEAGGEEDTGNGDQSDADGENDDGGIFGLGGLFDSLDDVDDFVESVTEKAEELDATVDDIQHVSDKIREAVKKAEEGKPEEAAKKLEDAAERVGERLDGETRDQLLARLDEVAERLDLPDLQLVERFGEPAEG